MFRPTRLAVAALVSVAVLSGCGVSDQALAPGVAAQVGDTRISINDLDEAVDGACSYFTESGTGNAIPRGDVRTQLLQLLVKRAAAEQMLAAHDADLDPGYEAAVGQNESQLAEAPAAQREGVLTGIEADIYYQAAVLGVGAALLVDEGATELDGAVAQERGEEEFAAWVSENDIDVNPLFGLDVDDGAVTIGSTDELAVAASDFSLLGARKLVTPQDTVREDYAAALPPDQTCG